MKTSVPTSSPFCAKTDADRAALQEFEDEVIDRLSVLNAARAREQERIGLGKKKVKGKRDAKKGSSRPAKSDSRQQTLGLEEDGR